jgi:uncharacterized membrane protein
MRTFLLTLHVVSAIFVVGPLVFAANRVAGALRSRDGSGLLPMFARIVPLYGALSVVVALLGFSLVRPKWGNELSDGWLLGSVALYVVGTALVLGVLTPLLRGAVRAGGSTAGLAPRAAAAGGLASLCYVAVAVLMVWQPR